MPQRRKGQAISMSMVITSASSPRSSTCSEQHRPKIVCGISSIATAVECGLRTQEWLAGQTELQLILDAPIGFALDNVRTSMGSGTVIMTWNGSSAYWADLWDRHPALLVINDYLSIEEALKRAAQGFQGRYGPPHTTMLNGTERAVLRELAGGWSTTDIATRLSMREKTVLNTFTTIYDKIGVQGRIAAYRAYCGT